MEPLRNAWYMAGWSDELSDKPFARKILGENIVFYRKSSGDPVALFNRCPHRFVPMDGGKVVDDTLRCPYHGLQFDSLGMCVLNPHPPHTFPENARVKSYPLLERYSGFWVWMGEGEPDEALMPDLGFTGQTDGYRVVKDLLPVKANYFLMVDNLLDLSHVPVLHEGSIGNPAMVTNVTYEWKRAGNSVVQTRVFPGIMTAPFYQSVYPPYKTMEVDRTQRITWMPAGNLLLEVIHHEKGAPDSHRTTQHTAHVLTPETETSCHYFTASTRDFALDSAEVDKQWIDAFWDVLDGEDRVLVESQQAAMGDVVDFMSLKPALLPTDAADVGAHRIMAELFKKERA